MVRIPVPLKLSQHYFSETQRVTANTDPRDFMNVQFIHLGGHLSFQDLTTMT